jgi:ATP-dependent Lhr-like helicase
MRSAVAGNKRGTHLITAVERLTLTSGEFQRIALSATVRPLEVVADFIGGFERLHTGNDTAYRKRPVRILRSDDSKRYCITVECPEKAGEGEDEETLWQNLAAELKQIVRSNRSTLVFTKSRRVAEKIVRHMNEGEDEIIAYSHHGSIAREIRLEVEERMKRGELKAIVATGSLELGIDIVSSTKLSSSRPRSPSHRHSSASAGPGFGVGKRAGALTCTAWISPPR